MTGKDQTSKLRKENERLKSELEEMKEQVKVLSDKIHESTRSPLSHTSVTEAEASSSLEFIGKQYDEMEAFKHQALRDINAITIKLGKMEAKCDEINACIQEIQDYSYQNNVKIVGMPATGTARENSETTADLCLKFFHSLGVEDVTIHDIDTAHRVPSRRQFPDRPDAIICKFVRRMVKEKAMTMRRNVNKLQASDLGFADHVSLAHLGLYDHLSPRLQNLLYEAKRVKVEQHFKFCWAKNGAVFLRKTDTSRIIKIKSMDDLTDLQDDDS